MRPGPGPGTATGLLAAAPAVPTAVLLTVLLAFLLVAVAGCGTTTSPLPAQARPLPAEDSPQPRAEPPPPPKAPGSPAPGPAAPDSGDPDCNPRESLPPPATLPPRGARGERISAIEEYGYLRVGVSTDALLFGSMDWRTAELRGFDVDIAREVARAIFGSPDRVQFRAVDTRDRERVLADGTVDMVVSTMTVTCARKERARFSGVYYEAGMRLLVPAHSGFAAIGDLAGRRVCSAQGSTSVQKLAELLTGPRRPVPVSRVTVLDCLVALQRGEIDAIATDDTLLAGMEAQDSSLRLLGPEAFAEALPPGGLEMLSEPYGIAIARTDIPRADAADSGAARSGSAHPDAARAADDEFVRFLNRVLLDLMNDGRWARMYDTYLRGALGGPGIPPSRTQRNWPDGVLVSPPPAG